MWRGLPPGQSLTLIEIRVDILWLPKFAMVETSRLCIVYATELKKPLKNLNLRMFQPTQLIPLRVCQFGFDYRVEKAPFRCQ